MYRVLNTAQVQAPAAGKPAGMPTINPQTINATMGKLTAIRNEIAFWIAQKTNQLEAVYPYTTPQDKHRILTMCLPLGMVPSIEECDTWGSVFASIYTITHGNRL